jgi:hypothetical protein
MNVGTMIGVCLALVLAFGEAAEAGAKRERKPPQGAPEYQAPPRAADGGHMALTVEKLEKGFDPDRPLLVWAIGSSFTNFLGNGSLLVEPIRQRFPNAPKIVYKKIVGNSTSYHFTLGWARHLVVPDQPDVVLIYNFGKTEDLEKVIAELRRHTTADILVPTLHWCRPHAKVWPNPEARNSHQDPTAMRAMCAKYGVEFVESRREITQYLLDNKLPFDSLLVDAVHQSPYCAKMINLNIARHVHRPKQFACDPRSRERRLEAEASEAVKAEGKWSRAEGALTTGQQGSTITVRFAGNRIDLIGRRSPDGGSAEVWIDGRPAGQAPVFYATYVQPNRKNAPAPPNPPRDRAPHLVELGTNIVPQRWTITMTSDTGDYRLVGAVTGHDGDGSAFKPFISASGQIRIDPAYWRGAKTNRTGDTFTFEVVRCAVGRVDFKGKGEKFRLRLVQNLSNGPHTLKLVAQGGGPVAVDAFDVFEPPLK